MQQIQVFPIPAFNDNYIWCLQNGEHAWVVDPGDAAPVLAYLRQHNLHLSGILVTHHHWDHTNGIAELVAKYSQIPVFGPSYGNIKHLTHRYSQGDRLQLPTLSLEFDVLEVPGHTLDHIAFYGDHRLFCGDTMFSAGCGRLFEGTPEQMLNSLKKLMQLPEQTLVYCTHEYTLANLQFAAQVEPKNQSLKEYTDWAKQQRDAGLPTLPSTIQQQKAINPFLRAQQDEIKHNAEQHVGKPLPNEETVFAAIRRWKDNF